MKILLTTLLPMLLGFSLLDCHSSKQPQTQQLLAGAYDYSGYDKTGAKVVEGQVEVIVVDSEHIKGQWQLKAVGNPEKLGPQVGTGSFAGEVKQDGISINLNPNMADNNVYLTGRFKNGRLNGRWSFSGFAGVINEGTFEAKKK